MRLFAAIPLPGSAQEAAARKLRELRALDWPVRWVHEEGLHLTLKFFGEVAPDRLETIVEMLQYRGFSVRAAVDGADALGVLDGWQPDVILLDLTMPVMDGYEFLTVRASRPELAAIPVVVTSATTTPTPSVPPWDELVSKPFQLDQLVDAIERCRARSA